MDIFPTLAAVVGLPKTDMVKPIDGSNLKTLFKKDIGKRKKPIPFRFMGKGALIDNNYKLIAQNSEGGRYVLYDLVNDFEESEDITEQYPEIAARMIKTYEAWSKSVDASDAGKDFPEGKLVGHDPGRRFWNEAPEYQSHMETFRQRPESAKWAKLKKK